METLQRLFAFMRENGIKKACWDDKLIFFMDSKGDFDRMANAIQQPDDLADSMQEMFGDRHDRPLWFHV